MDKINKNYGENRDKMTGTPNGSKSQNYGQTTNQESWKDRVADKVDNAASKVADKVDNAANKMADKVHEKVAQHKSGTTDSSSRMDHNGMGRPIVGRPALRFRGRGVRYFGIRTFFGKCFALQYCVANLSEDRPARSERRNADRSQRLTEN